MTFSENQFGTFFGHQRTSQVLGAKGGKDAQRFKFLPLLFVRWSCLVVWVTYGEDSPCFGQFHGESPQVENLAM